MPNIPGGVWLIHPEHGVHKVPDNPGVIAYFTGRDYEVTDLPAQLDSDDPEFIQALDKLQAEDQEEAKPTKTKKSVEAKSATEEEKEDK